MMRLPESYNDLCACGRPLHYTDPLLQATVAELVRKQGEFIIVHCAGRQYRVQRHYIALHGLRATELETLAGKGIIEKVIDR